MKSSFASTFAFSGALLLATSLRAEVVETTANGFQSRRIVTIAAPHKKVFADFLKVGSWWNSAHTYSGKARNLRIEPRAGGCFCETLPGGGGVLHMTIVHFAPNDTITLSGGLGPLQTSGMAGAMTIQVKSKDGKTELTLTYNVGGFYPGAEVKALASPVDQVLSEQLDRLKRFVESGSPEAK